MNTINNTLKKVVDALEDKKAENIEAISEVFNTHELVKIAVLKNCIDDPKEIATVVAERTRSQVVQVIGKKFVLYKPFKQNPKIILPK